MMNPPDADNPFKVLLSDESELVANKELGTDECASLVQQSSNSSLPFLNEEPLKSASSIVIFASETNVRN